MSLALEVFSDLSERLNYNLPDFPMYVREGTLRQFDRYAAACHWHWDLEFVVVLDGSMEYYVNGQIVRMEAGSGIFVNSKRLHYGFSTEKKDCSYLVVAVHPSLLGNNTHVGKLYLEEKFGPDTEDYILLRPQVVWQQEILNLMTQMYAEIHSSARNPLRLLAQATSLCASIGDNLQPISKQHSNDQIWVTVWKMAEFIHQHYELKITLDDIASAGIVCRSRCCELFSKYVNQTPGEYLTRYRIQKSCEMLRETNRAISEVGIACGFQSGSYFTYVFRKEMSLTPQDYRKQTGRHAAD